MRVNGKSLSYNAQLKAQFKTLSMAYLRKLKSELQFTECKVSFNAGGIAVSGDAHLMGMFSNGIGVYITINESWNNRNSMTFLFRTIKNMKDYTGGPNNYFNDEHLQGEVVMNNIKSLCNVS